MPTGVILAPALHVRPTRNRQRMYLRYHNRLSQVLGRFVITGSTITHDMDFN